MICAYKELMKHLYLSVADNKWETEYAIERLIGIRV